MLLATLSLLALGGCSSDDASYDFSVCDPSCPRGYYLVADCEDESECEHIETCDGGVLACVPILGSADAGDYDSEPDASNEVCVERPACPSTSEEVDVCPTDRFCTRVTVCGFSALCLDPLAVCEEPPSCPEGWVDDASCEDFDPTCAELRHCDETFRCRRCDNLPTSCPDDFESVAPDDCDYEAGCQQVLTCEGYLSCAPQSPECTEEPACPENFEPVDACPDDAVDCEVVEVCDQELTCAHFDDACTEPPTCPEGHEPVERCTDEYPGCETLEICGERLFCVPPRCEPASCPEGYAQVSVDSCTEASPCESFEDCHGNVVYCTPP